MEAEPHGSALTAHSKTRTETASPPFLLSAVPKTQAGTRALSLSLSPGPAAARLSDRGTLRIFFSPEPAGERDTNL